MSKFKIKYRVEGEIEIEADNKLVAFNNFNDKVGFSNDDLYENLDNCFVIFSIEEKNK